MIRKRRSVLPLIALFLCIGIVQCASKNATTGTTPPPPTVTNARDTADANAFRVIADAYAFISSIRNSVTSGSLTLTASQKTAFNAVVASYNVAYNTGRAYHNGTSSDSTTLTNQTNALSAQLATAKTVIPQ